MKNIEHVEHHVVRIKKPVSVTGYNEEYKPFIGNKFLIKKVVSGKKGKTVLEGHVIDRGLESYARIDPHFSPSVSLDCKIELNNESNVKIIPDDELHNSEYDILFKHRSNKIRNELRRLDQVCKEKNIDLDEIITKKFLKKKKLDELSIEFFPNEKVKKEYKLNFQQMIQLLNHTEEKGIMEINPAVKRIIEKTIKQERVIEERPAKEKEVAEMRELDEKLWVQRTEHITSVIKQLKKTCKEKNVSLSKLTHEAMGKDFEDRLKKVEEAGFDLNPVGMIIEFNHREKILKLAEEKGLITLDEQTLDFLEEGKELDKKLGKE